MPLYLLLKCAFKRTLYSGFCTSGRREMTGNYSKLGHKTRSLIHYILSRILLVVKVTMKYSAEKRVQKPDGERPLGRPRRWWGDNIKVDHQEIGCEMKLCVWGSRVVNRIMNEFCKRQGIYWLDEQLSASQDVFYSLGIVISDLSGK